MIMHWSVSPELLEMGPLRVRWYGLMFLTGFSLGYYLMQKVCRWENKPTEKLESLLIHLVLGTTIGARLGHCLFYDPSHYLSHPLEILKIWEGGLASHGGGLGVIFSLILFSRNNSEFKLWWLLDRIAIFTVMTGAFIRIGNLMNSEILGRPTDGTWGVVFDRVDAIPRHPSMMYESLCYALIFFVTYRLYLKWKEKSPPGFLFGAVISLIMICRFAIEFTKENQSAFEADMVINMGQLLSIPFVLYGGYLVKRDWGKIAKPGQEDEVRAEPTKKGRKKRK